MCVDILNSCFPAISQHMLSTYMCWTLQNGGKRNEIHIESFMPMQKYLYILVYMNDACACAYVKGMEIYINLQMYI